jgi:hypothetical protein
MGVANWFETFCSNIKMSSDTVATISGRYKQITKRLNTDYYNSDSDTYHSLYVGSYGRDTEIYASDIDMLFEMPTAVYHQYNNYQGNGQSALLQAVKTSIKKTYSDTDMKGDGQIIQVKFTDGIIFEVLPAFLTNNNKTFLFADSNGEGSWKETDPRSEFEAMNTRNNNCNGNLKLLCKMMRAWKDKMNVPIKGLLIDTLAYQFLENYTNKDKSYLYYDFMSRDYFEYLKNQDEKQTYWRAPGSLRYVNNSDNFRYKATMAFNLSKEAIEKENYETTAKSKWRDIFGTKFPS